MTGAVLEPARPLARRRPAGRLALASWRSALAVISLVLAAGIVGWTVSAVFRLQVPLPIWDTWFTIADAKLVKQGTYGWTELTRQHNEHRLLFPRLLFLADRSWFAMSDRDLLAESFALQAVTAAAILWLGAKLCPDRAARTILAGLVVAALFSLDQEQNFTNGFQVQFVGVFTAAALGTWAYAGGIGRLGAGSLGGRVRPGGWMRLALAGAAAFVATYTMANGVLLGFALVVLAILARAPWTAVVATLAVSAALAAAFFHGYVPGPESGSVAGVLAHPLRTAGFVVASLGGPAGPDLRIALPFGALGLLGLGLAAARLAAGRSRSPAAAALVGLMGFVVASACATAYGRVQFGLEEAFETRYVTPAAVFWCAWIAVWGTALGPRAALPGGSARWGRPVVGLVAVWLAANAVVQEATEWPFMVDQATAIRRFRDSLWSGLYDLDASSYENNTDSDLRPLIPFLAAEHLSLFAAPEPGERGEPLASLGTIAPDGRCAGTVSAASDPRLGAGGVRVTGTAWDRGADRPVRRILTIGPDGTLSGFGSPDRPVGRPRRFTGYATAAVGQRVEAYAALRDGLLCRLGTAEVAAP